MIKSQPFVLTFTKYYFAVCFILLPVFAAFGQSVTDKKITVIFRFDDYAANSNTALEVKVMDAFHEIKQPFTIGVIPFVWDQNKMKYLPLDNMKLQLLEDAYNNGIAEVALHGYSHRQNNDRGIRTEFEGLEYPLQFEKLAEGKRFLEDLTSATVTTFIPPWNSYDATTLEALEALGFNNISADQNGIPKPASPLKFIPNTCSLIQLKDAVSTARQIKDKAPVIIVMFHEYDFIEADQARGNISFDEFYELLQWTINQNDVVITSINRAGRLIPDLSAKRYHHIRKHYLVMQRLFPSFRMNLDGIYPSRKMLAFQKVYVWLYILSIPVFVGIITFLISRRIFIKQLKVLLTLKYLFLILSIILLGFYATQFAGYKVTMMLQIIVGITLGLWTAWLLVRRKLDS